MSVEDNSVPFSQHLITAVLTTAFTKEMDVL